MSSSSTSPSQPRRKPAPPRTPVAEIPALPDPPQEEATGLTADFGEDEDEDNEEADTAALIDPSTIPPARSSLFSSSLLGSTSAEADITPRPSRLSRAVWDTPDTYPPFHKPPGRDRAQEPRSGTPVITVDLNAPQDNNLSYEEIEALKILLSRPSRSKDPVYQYIRKEGKKLLVKNRVSTSKLNSPIKSQELEISLWMSAVFGKTLKKVRQFLPAPDEAFKEIIFDIPEVSFSEFTKHALEEANEQEDQPYTITVSDDFTSIISH